MTISIWGRYLNNKPEKVDDIPKNDVGRCLHEYMLAFGAMPGQSNYKKWKLWIGRLKDEPCERDSW